jgi:hypothetical protein
MQRLLDHVSDIPTLLAEYDILTASTNINTISQSEFHDRHIIFWATLSDIESRLRQWKVDHADSYPAGQPYEVPIEVDCLEEPIGLSYEDDGLPIFQYRDLSSLEIITPTLIAYPDPNLAHTLCLYYATLLTMSRIDTRPECGIQPFEQHRLACLICRSIRYFIQAVPGNLILRMMFPLRTACDSLPEGSLEQKWVQAMFLWIGRTRPMGSSVTLRGEFSVQTKRS